MEFKLIDGKYTWKDTQHLVGELIRIKINYLEEQISKEDSEEDIKIREQRIKTLQNELTDLLNKKRQHTDLFSMHVSINIES